MGRHWQNLYLSGEIPSRDEMHYVGVIYHLITHWLVWYIDFYIISFRYMWTTLLLILYYNISIYLSAQRVLKRSWLNSLSQVWQGDQIPKLCWRASRLGWEAFSTLLYIILLVFISLILVHAPSLSLCLFFYSIRTTKKYANLCNHDWTIFFLTTQYFSG